MSSLTVDCLIGQAESKSETGQLIAWQVCAQMKDQAVKAVSIPKIA